MGNATITFYGGVNEVGGNKILISDGDTQILLDFGMSFTLRNQYYSPPFLSPKSGAELIAFGILPKISGAYEFEDSERSIDAVFISHSHMDHSAYISFLKRSIPIYSGETTLKILEAYGKASFSDLEFNLSGLEFHTFRTGDKIGLGSMEVRPVHVDHSVPGSYGFIIHNSSGTIVYTGDLRRHGPRPDLTDDFVNQSVTDKPDILICENTNMTNVEISSEREVMEKISEIVKSTRGLVLANFACSDMDRLRSFYMAAAQNGRELVVTPRQAYLLNSLQKDPHLDIPKIKDLLILRRGKRKFLQWEEEIMNLGETVDAKFISKRQDKIILASSFYDLGELTEIKPAPGSSYILSASEPFNEEMELDFNRLLNWLDHYGLPQYHVHVSGHIVPLHLRETLKMIKPKRIFPIHGTRPELFQKFVRDLKGRVICPKRGKTYRIK
ncbi:MAG: MBL fold metallo-hydrolase [Nitrososphaerota archaeon]|nr:MBL fold metallo-hydrolase [Candidatus Bathyarchaeota archaeon]MDW8048160.1 MBL fold metallo-hydrolase [Nitrososphaerota archaeon]